MPRQAKKARKINPVARSLRLPGLKRRVEKPKKGKGSYTRKGRHGTEAGKS